MNIDKLWAVIPAAGKSQRYIEAGYTTRKPLLQIRSQEGNVGSMIAHVEHSLPNTVDHSIVVFDEGMERPSDLSAEVMHIRDSKGQSDSIYQAVKILPAADRVLVLDCDMVLHRGDLDTMVKLLVTYDVVIAVADTFDPNASRVDQIPFPTIFVEKEPISQWGIIGARAFRRADKLTKALEASIHRCSVVHREPYLSLALNHYAGTKFAMLVYDYQDWGTPLRLIECGAKIL